MSSEHLRDVCRGCGATQTIAAHGVCWGCYARVSRGLRANLISGFVVCLRCADHGQSVCWICESAPRLAGRTTCRRCQSACDRLTRYWRQIGMPLSYDGHVAHPTTRRQAA